LNTCLQLIAAMKHALGVEDVPSGVNLWSILNHAGNALFTWRDWSWRTVRDPALCPAVAGESSISLPPGFDTLIHCTGIGTTARIELIDPTEWMQRSQYETTGTYHYSVCFLQSSPGAGKGQKVRPIARIHPVPTTNGQPTLRVLYTLRWMERFEGVDDNSLPNIPPEFDRCLEMLCRAMAVETDEDDSAPSTYRQSFKDEVARLIVNDQRKQTDHGRMTGGGAARYMNRNCLDPLVLANGLEVRTET